MSNLFIIEPREVLQDKRLSAVEKDYLCLIAALEKAGGCTASNSFFADYFGVSRPRAVEVIASLRNKKFLECKEKKHGQRTIHRKLRIVDNFSKSALLTDSKDSPVRVVRKHLQDSKESPNLIIKENKDKKREGSRSFSSILEEAF